MEADARANLERLIGEWGEEYSSLSRLLGRNAAYIQQYLKRGSPRSLAERDRRLLAGYFGVAEELLGGPPAGSQGTVAVPRLDIGASAGGGAPVDTEARLAPIRFDPAWLHSLGAKDARMLSMIRVAGDSMSPTLEPGDEILVDRNPPARRPASGIFVLRIEGALVVKRIRPAGRGRFAITSDNPAYPATADLAGSDAVVVGRVLWTGRKLA